ncbi:hypothetical protein P389DRAFT_192017 [Cystobasidium minutum MCA 4210]|uniref:uncharacterized protein n=1 Tax=Cystobasidium minutum MCA 4210 TaxID=1397322 RepID=UPI0034CEC4B1|eukprot:jgi/Rhomi1/192017/gm1.231_g
MTRSATQPESLTLVIEDPAHAAVNISSLSTSSFDYYMSTNLLLPLGAKDSAGPAGSNNPAAVGQQVDPREVLQRNQSSRWMPRPSFAQIEGVTISDPTADFRISVGMISGRGGTAGAGGTVAPDLVILLEYLPTDFFDSPVGYGLLEDYISSLLPKYATYKDVSAETTFLDWKSLLSIRPEEPKVPPWSPRNTSWCLVKMCKEARMLLDSNALPSASEMSYVDEDDKPQSIHINVSDPTLLLIPACAATFGFASGLLSGAKKSSLQFLAENAHRQPTTLQGWYFYNKTKNYRVALGGAKTGLFTAAKLGAWTSGFVALKEGASRIGLGRTESGAISGTLLAMFASVVYKLPKRTLPKRLLLGLGIGALTGGLQELRELVRRKKEQHDRLV